MVVVTLHDSRYRRGNRVKFFDQDDITQEVIAYVKKYPNAYKVKTFTRVYTREEFLTEFG